MREILFRGKRMDDDEWVEGYYFTNPEWDREMYGSCYWIVSHKNGIQYEVSSETLGQYTGLNDKNGKKIFEGDLVRAENICNGYTWFGSVVWWNGCFAIQGVIARNVPAIDLFREYEVIGNIHDNPELLEG